MNETTLPEHPLDRFLELLDALMEQKRWFEDPTALRFAASAMLLIDNGQRSQTHVGSDQVGRFAALYAEMKGHHLFLTGQDDYPTCALLSSLPGAPSELGQRCEVFYEGLRDLGFSLACGTGFLELAGDQIMNEHLRGTQNILAVQAIIQAQQAAMMAAAVSASAAASSASHS